MLKRRCTKRLVGGVCLLAVIVTLAYTLRIRADDDKCKCGKQPKSPASQTRHITARSTANTTPDTSPHSVSDYISWDVGEPRQVLLVSYQRSGSTVLGELFNQHPQAFYWFEPLDGVYSSLYGTQLGYNTPVNIWNEHNASVRAIPKFESNAVIDTVKQILECKFEKLGVEVLAHPLLRTYSDQQLALLNYTACLGDSIITRLKNCNSRLAMHCGRLFGSERATMAQCHQVIQTNQRSGRTLDMSETKQAVTEYLACRAPVEERVSACLPHLMEACEKARIRVVKTVRMRMSEVYGLKLTSGRLRVLHGLRDPRAVVVSRRQQDQSFRGLTSGNDIIKEAELLCKNMVTDIRLKTHLMQQFPHSVHSIIFEDFARKPSNVVKKLYKFLQLELPNEVMSWLLDHTTAYKAWGFTSRNSTHILTAWTDKINYKQVLQINHKCTQFFNLLKHKWI